MGIKLKNGTEQKMGNHHHLHYSHKYHQNVIAGPGGDYYCDANHGGGIWCPEYDVMEGNRHTMACTLHTCNGGGGNWDYCDGGGCQANAFNVNSGMMCPGG